METLLAHVVKRFATSQWENIATDSVHYLLGRDGVEAALLRTLGTALKVDEPLRWQTQLDNADLSRPDLVGRDSQGRPKVVVEAKFGAALTDNQPLAYLAAQEESFPGKPECRMLAFVVPASRRHIIEAELRRRLESTQDPHERLTHDVSQETALLIDHRVMVVTWGDLLAQIRTALTEAGDDSGLRDLDQLSGLCDRADAEAMLPLSDEDLDPGRAKRFQDCWGLVDRSVKRLASTRIVASKNWSNGFWGPGAFLTTHGGDRFWFGLYLAYWAHRYPTPFWLFFENPPEHVNRAILERRSDPRFPFVTRLSDRDRTIVAIPAPLGVEADQAVEQLVDFVSLVCDLLPEGGTTVEAQAPAADLEE